MLVGVRTKYYNEVKEPVIAGMQFGTNNTKMRKIGYDVFRHYYATAEKDGYIIGYERIERVLNY